MKRASRMTFVEESLGSIQQSSLVNSNAGCLFVSLSHWKCNQKCCYGDGNVYFHHSITKSMYSDNKQLLITTHFPSSYILEHTGIGAVKWLNTLNYHPSQTSAGSNHGRPSNRSSPLSIPLSLRFSHHPLFRSCTDETTNRRDPYEKGK